MPKWRSWFQRLGETVRDLGAAIADLGSLYIAKATLTTRGDLLVRDASAPTRLALGAAGTVLTAGATDPTWTALPATGWTLVQGPTSVGTGTTYSVTGLARYSVLLIVLEDVSHNGGGSRNIGLRVGIAGPTYRTSGYSGQYNTVTAGGNTIATSTTQIVLSSALSAAGAVVGQIMLTGFGGATTKTTASADLADSNGSVLVAARYNTAEAHDAIQLLLNGSGNFDGGTVTIWGMA